MKRVVIKRSALYALIWERPMIHVGADFGVTGNGLKKICIRYAIPRPPAGYFLMKPDKRRRLGQELPDPGNDPAITIQGDSDQGARAVELDDVVIPSSIDPEVSREIDAYIKELRAHHGKDERGIIYPKNQGSECLLRVSLTKVGVAAMGLKRVLSALKANGCQVEFRSQTESGGTRETRKVRVSYGEASEDLRVEEPATRAERPFTASELKEKQRQEANGWTHYRRDPWLFTPTGKPQLVFSYSRRRILREDVRPIVQAVISHLKAWDHENREREARIRHDRAVRLWALRGLRRKLWEERQFEAIEKEAKRWARAERLRGYVAKVAGASGEQQTSEWLAMAKRLIDDLDPLSADTFGRIVPLPKYKEVEQISNKQGGWFG